MVYFNAKASKETRFSKAVIPPTERIGTASTNDNMIQQRYIHSSSRLAELSGKLDIRRAW
jgi:hypothetical protein